MAISITPEIEQAHEAFRNSLFIVECLKDAFCNAPPSVDPEPFQYLIDEAVKSSLERFDILCGLLGLPN
jgi:hypothetical protein